MWFKDSILLAATVSAAHTGIRHATTVLECLMKQSNEWVFREKQLAAPGGGWARSVSVADLSIASSISMSVIPARNTRHAITDSTLYPRHHYALVNHFQHETRHNDAIIGSTLYPRHHCALVNHFQHMPYCHYLCPVFTRKQDVINNSSGT